MDKIYRTLDANLNRTREGLRVIEEIARLYLDDRGLAKRLKLLRSELAGATRDIAVKLIRARNAKGDVGAGIHSRKEKERLGILDVFTANSKRVEESLRVLEEFSKLVNKKMGLKFKALRFKFYTLEKDLYIALSGALKREQLDFTIYPIIDLGVSSRLSPVTLARQFIRGGARVLQLRGKDITKSKFLKIATKVSSVANKAGITFIINDHVDIARQVNADGVHVGQEDMAVKVARKIIGPDKIIGVSAANLKAALKGQQDGADYVGVGPIFATPFKQGHRGIGTRVLREIRRRLKVPVVAIGGIDTTNIRQISRAGVRRIAVIRAVCGDKDATRATLKLRKLLEE